MRTINENDIPRALTPTNALPILPTSLKGCYNLLKAQGHVNIKDYMAEREIVRRKRHALIEEKIKKGKQGEGYEKLTEEEEEDLRAELKNLVFPSASLMAK